MSRWVDVEDWAPRETRAAAVRRIMGERAGFDWDDPAWSFPGAVVLKEGLEAYGPPVPDHLRFPLEYTYQPTGVVVSVAMLDRLSEMFGILRVHHEPDVPAMPAPISDDDAELQSIEAARHG